MSEIFLRTKLLIGEEKFKILQKSKVLVFGVGGVGSVVAESLVRTGIKYLDICDGDNISITNLNRQIMTDFNNIGAQKTHVLKNKLLNINPDLIINTFDYFFDETTCENFEFENYDFVIDCIDNIKSKIMIILKSQKNNVKIISCMGTGNKLNPMDLEFCDIYKTSVCPLARIMRRELKKNNVKSLDVVYSREKPRYVPNDRINSSAMFVPATAGLIISSEVIKKLVNLE